MPLIDGVGDEVIEFLIAVLLVLVAALAWWSTNARPDRYASTVLVMRSRAHHTVTVCTSSRQNPAITRAPNANQTSSSDSSGASSSSRVPGARTEAARAGARVHVPLQEMDSIVDADLAMMNNNRLHFYRRIDSPSSAHVTTEPVSEMSETPEESVPASNAQIQEMDNIVRAMEAEVTTFCDILGNDRETADTTTSTDPKGNKSNVSEGDAAPAGSGAAPDAGDASTSGAPAPDARRILIKLKYLNDTLKEVEGSLDELLKDFKWRHFSTELSSACRVRLIFNGRVLCDEAATLSALGLHHRAVVHCLVHPGRSNAQQPALEEPPLEAPPELLTGAPQVERVWDLENILMTLVSVALTVVWFFRCEYSNLFTASASVALLALTVLYSVAIFGLYLSDAFHFDRRPAPAQAQAQAQPPPPQTQQPVNN